MPWTKADVERFNKGLDDSQKERWVAVANAALDRCLSKGGNENDCAALAIKYANGVVKNN